MGLQPLKATCDVYRTEVRSQQRREMEAQGGAQERAPGTISKRFGVPEREREARGTEWCIFIYIYIPYI